MSLQALVHLTFEELERTRDLFGSAPRPAGFTTTAELEATHAALTAQHSTAATAWTGAGSRGYGDAAGASIATLGRAIPADEATSAGMQAAGAAASRGRQAMDEIIEQTRAGVAAIAPSTDTAAGRQQLVGHLQNQLAQAHTVVRAAALYSAVAAAQIRAAADGYQGRAQMVDNHFALDTPPPVPPPRPVTGEPIKLPQPSGPPPVTVIDASPPDGASGGPPPGVGFPKCEPDTVIGRFLEILAGGTLAGVSVPGEAVTGGAATAGILGGASLVYNGADGLKNCK